MWQYHVCANGNLPLAPVKLFGNAVGLASMFDQALNDPQHAEHTPAPAPSLSSEVLVLSPPLNADEITMLADRKTLDATLLRSVFFSQTLPSNALDGIERALKLYTFCQSLNIHGASLGKLSAPLLQRDFASLSEGADFLLSILQARYQDQAARDKTSCRAPGRSTYSGATRCAITSSRMRTCSTSRIARSSMLTS
jgi:hypothetical protein